MLLCALAAACAQPGVSGDDTPGADGGGSDTGVPCTAMCGGMCVDTKTDGANCGKCGNACPTGATCVLGACQCGMGASKCGAACVTVATDPKNCGKCGLSCGGDGGAIMGGGTWGCAAGACKIVCPQPKAECSGACVDTSSDSDNCGACGNACMQGTETCSSGMCCPTGQTNCSGTCTDTQFDPKNCSACGKACPVNTPYCNMGQCTQCDNSVLLLADSNSGPNGSFQTAANQAGLNVTLQNGGVSSYSGSPSASNFAVTVVMVGDAYSTDMPSAGQQSIVSAQGSGRGVAITDWGGYHVYSGRWATLKSVNLATYTTGAAGNLQFTLTQNNHPLWTGLPSTFAGSATQGCQGGSITNSGTQIASLGGPCSGPGVVVRGSPNGRIVYVSHAAAYSGASAWVNDSNMVKLTINAIKWATGCLL